MRYFATSDTHFGHTNIIRFCNRPFESVEAMDEALIARWNQRVSAEDIVYFLGDFSMGPNTTDEYVAQVLEKLNGTKLVVLGNHDEPQKKKYTGLKLLLQHRPILGTVLGTIHDEQIDGKHFVMCHFPMSVWNQSHKGSIHLHGHVHTEYSTDRFPDFTGPPNRYDVGVDLNGGPVEITGDCRYLKNPKGWA